MGEGGLPLSEPPVDLRSQKIDAWNAPCTKDIGERSEELMICAKHRRVTLFLSAVGLALLGFACSAEPEPEETAMTDQELSANDRCGSSNFMRVALVGMCPKKSKWQWSRCYHTNTTSRDGRDVDDRLADDREACYAAGSTYICGSRTTAYQPCSCCKYN